MKIKPFFERIITSPKRSLAKQRVLKKISNSEQTNDKLVNIYRLDPGNVGDFYCAPHHYFKKLKNTSLDIFEYKSVDKEKTDQWIKRISESKLIIGGGGLLNRGSFERQMKLFEHLGKTNKKIVLWGLGHNSQNKKDFGKISSYNIDTRSFGLVGTRDYNPYLNNWVPCASCLHPIFDKSYVPAQDIGVVFHKKTMKNRSITSRFENFPSTSNTTNLEDLISFIGNSGTIITDSYHAMYWAILMEKKVVVIPNSSKFFNFKYPPVISTFENSIPSTKKARSYSGVLEECREINLNFAEKVFEYLEL